MRRCFGVDYDVVDVDGDLSRVDKVSEDVVHYQLECGGWVH